MYVYPADVLSEAFVLAGESYKDPSQPQWKRELRSSLKGLLDTQSTEIEVDALTHQQVRAILAEAIGGDTETGQQVRTIYAAPEAETKA